MKTIRCAIYTRKSTDEGLEQDFNSLDAQREAGEAYIKSQQHEGWGLIPTQYNDGGFSGGTMERPALKQLLADIEAGQVDIVVVYKVDRLSRALSDFAKMVEIFDAHEVSFVSVTQSFNTTTSMGRLTLNVLLSFAQFEREVTGERIRDKFAASKKKGMWMGGRQPLGYDVRQRKLHVNEEEAESVRFIFESYLNQPPEQPFYEIVDRLKVRGITNKCYVTQKGKQVVGGEFTVTQLYKLLKNPVYNGKIRHKKEVFEGEHAAIIDDILWQSVQTKLSDNTIKQGQKRKSDGPAFAGRLYDYLGNKFSPTYSYKYSANGRYKMRYYINRQIRERGKATSEFKRIRADYLDEVIQDNARAVLQSLCSKIRDANNSAAAELLAPTEQVLAEIKNAIVRVTLHPSHMELSLKLQCVVGETLTSFWDNEVEVQEVEDGLVLTYKLPTQYRRAGGQLHIIAANGGDERFETDATRHFPNDKTFEFIAKAFYWNREIESGKVSTIEEIAKRDSHNAEYVKKALKQRFLPPSVIESVARHERAEQVSVERLVKCNEWSWRNQAMALGC